jgi:hypothetical protein
MLGKTYLRLEKHEKARCYLKLASLYPPQTDDDLQVRWSRVHFVQFNTLFSEVLIANHVRTVSLLLRDIAYMLNLVDVKCWRGNSRMYTYLVRVILPLCP